MRFDELNESNYLLFAIKFYDNPQAVTKDDFEDDLKIDSLDIIELVIKIEDQFNVEIDDETATELKTVADVLDFILTASVDDSAN